ncbi:MAG: CpsD/CapB family tyrosine-protein kinase [Phycisphaerales bacterium]|nr:MAG: CpsD/CapB family tyrosine-protein kinase [Phycisphaerales bacterium]
MGRIADALKRAEQERGPATAASSERLGAIATLPEPSAPTCTAEPTTTPTDKGTSEQHVSVVEGLFESLVPFYESSSLVTEQYRSLRTRLLSQNPHYEHRVIAVTSAVPKEGKSVTSLNLGCILAEIRHLKVLVVDGDFRRSSLAQMLNQAEGPGLAEVLSGDVSYDEVLRDTPVPNLRFIPAGSTNKRPAAELLTAAGAKPTFKRMQNDFHYTFVDTPPATTVTDVGIIGQMCTGVIMIVRLHRTHEAAAKRAVRLLQVNNVPVVGCMIVGRDSAVGHYGYGYDYGYRYNYYRYYNYIKHAEDDA